MTNEYEASGSSRWLADLRREFVRLASRRVDADDVEDVVQDAMRVIAEKGIDRGAAPVGDAMPLAWCFQVLRNTIGNHYQRQRTKQRWTDTNEEVVARAPANAIESLDSGSTLSVIEGALADMAKTDGKCAGYLSRLADGARAGDIADEESVERAAFYRRLYRCRQKLRELLVARGVAL